MTFPFIHDYPASIIDIPLEYSIRRPVCICIQNGIEYNETNCKYAGAVFSSEEPCLLLDFGCECVGWVTFVLYAADVATLRVNYGEHTDEALCCEPSSVHFYTLQEDTFNLHGGEEIHCSHGRRAFRYIMIRAISGVKCTIKDMYVKHQHAQIQQQGKFTCSDERLNRIWEISRETTLLCMQNYYEDGIKRDGLLWTGDYRVQYLCSQYCFGTHPIARKSLSMIAASQREDGAIPACAGIGGGKQHPDVIDCMPGIPTFPEKWILYNYMTDFISAVAEYAFFSGEEDAIEEFAPAIRRAIAHLCARDSFTVQDVKDHFISDDNISIPGVEQPYRPMAALLSHLYWGLKDGAECMMQIGDDTTAQKCHEQCSALRTVLYNCFYDEKTGLFNDEKGATQHGCHVNSIAALSDLTDNPHSLMHRLIHDDHAIELEVGFLRFWFLEVLCQNGFHSIALERVRDAWGKIIDAGFTTCPEVVYSDPQRYFTPRSPLSYCHGWSAAPAWLLPRYITGIQPIEKGWDTIHISPHLEGLIYAHAEVPTPHGMLSVKVDEKGISYSVPNTIKVQVNNQRLQNDF